MRTHIFFFSGRDQLKYLYVIVACMGEVRNDDKVLARKHVGKRSVGRRRLRYEGNIEMDLKEISCEGVDLTG
jgi:hypothetical protein